MTVRPSFGGLALAVLAVLAALAIPAPVLAGPQRALIRDANGTYTGVRANISSDTGTPTVPTTSGAAVFSRMGICTTGPYGTCTGGLGTTQGQYQVGQVKTMTKASTCTLPNFNYEVHCQEWLTLGGDGAFHGIQLGPIVFQYGGLYTVVRDPVAGYWRVYTNSTYRDTKGPLGFNTAAPVAAAEWIGVGPPSNFNMRWGLSAPAWQSSANFASWVNIPGLSREVVNSNSFNRVGAPPSSFTLNK